jgi:DNA-binding GntR family transcriptional regulator
MLQDLTIEKITTTERVTAALRNEMLAGRLPPGQQLSEISVSQSLGISRNTLREAIQQLEHEGLLSWKGNRRVVTVPTLENVREVYQVRRLLETAGIAASKQASPSLMQNLEECYTALENGVIGTAPEILVEQHIAFHEAIVGFLESPLLSATFRTAMHRLRLVFLITDHERADLPEQNATHLQVLELLRAGKLQACSDLVRNNLERAEKEVLESLERTNRIYKLE